MIPVKYGMSFTAKFMNQGSALVNVYRDGSVLISHGGIEMGQGIHTKIIQIAARALNIPHDIVKIVESSTAVVPNSMPAVASMSTDIYGEGEEYNRFHRQ
jgi:xanthine dehydrogenase/oxidase